MLDEILKSDKLHKILFNYERRDTKLLKKYRDNYYDVKNLFNVGNFKKGDIIFTVNKYDNKHHNKVTPCKIMSDVKVTTKNKFNYIDVKLLNVKSKNGKENTTRLYFLDYNIDVNDTNVNMIFTNKDVAEFYSHDYDPKHDKMYKIDKKRLRNSYNKL